VTGEKQDLLVVGAGILGLASAREYLVRNPGQKVTVVEKEADVARHQSSHNSGVVHAGLYYTPGSLKARLCRRGVSLLDAFASEHRIPLDKCGKLVVATREADLARLAGIEDRAAANGVPFERLDPAQMVEIEPHVRGLAAIHSPTTAIIDYEQVCRALVEEIRARGGSIETSTGVRHVQAGCADGVALTVSGTRLTADRILVCAGLMADRLARCSGRPAAPRIVPFRGEYWKLRPERRHLVKALIYPVPDPTLPFLGIHLTRHIDGEVLIGPNAVLALAREGYGWGNVDARQIGETMGWAGSWKLFGRHWKTGVGETARSLSKRLYVNAARAYVPELRPEDVVKASAGVRAQAIDPDGSLVDDFRIESDAVATWVRNAPSPAATSSLAIAEELVDTVEGARAPSAPPASTV
jgi:(S)-2-hydroxyglutarate dehydrogenase